MTRMRNIVLHGSLGSHMTLVFILYFLLFFPAVSPPSCPPPPHRLVISLHVSSSNAHTVFCLGVARTVPAPLSHPIRAVLRHTALWYLMIIQVVPLLYYFTGAGLARIPGRTSTRHSHRAVDSAIVCRRVHWLADNGRTVPPPIHPPIVHSVEIRTPRRLPLARYLSPTPWIVTISRQTPTLCTPATPRVPQPCA